MRDKDTDLIYEAYAGDMAAYKKGQAKEAIAARVKAKFDMEVQWDEGSGKWWRLDAGDPREVTGDEKMDIWSIEDKDSYMQHKAEGEGMRRQLDQAGGGNEPSDEDIWPQGSLDRFPVR